MRSGIRAQPPVDPYIPPTSVPSATLGNDVEIIPAWPGLITYYDAEAVKKDFQLELLLNLASDLVFFAFFGGLGSLAALGRGLALIPNSPSERVRRRPAPSPVGTSIATMDDRIRTAPCRPPSRHGSPRSAAPGPSP